MQREVFGIELPIHEVNERDVEEMATMFGSWKLWHFWGGGRQSMGFVGFNARAATVNSMTAVFRDHAF